MLRVAKTARLLATRRAIVRPSALGPFNTTSAATTTGVNFDGSASSSAIELGVVYNPAGIFGHKYWLAWCPYTNADVINENPCIAFGDDGNTWSTTGITNPIAKPSGAAGENMADCALLDNVSRDGKLYCFFNWSGRTPTSSGGVFVMSTTNGTTWSSLTQVLAISGTSDNTTCPVVCYDSASSTYWMYTINLATGQVYRWTCATPTGTWAGPVSCSMPMPGGRTPWHIAQPVKIGSKWVFATSDSDTSRNGWLLSSTDGLNWTCASHTLISAIRSGAYSWEGPGIYRPAIQDAGDGVSIYLWYVTGLSAPSLLSLKSTVPISEIP